MERPKIPFKTGRVYHELTALNQGRQIYVFTFGSGWKHLNRNHDILELVEAGGEHMLSGLQRVSGGCQVHVQIKDKIKEFKAWKSPRENGK